MEEKVKPTTILGTLPRTDPSIIAAMKNSQAEHNHYAALGRVAAAWAFLEAWIDTACVRLVDLPPERGVCLTSQIAGIGKKLDAFIALARLWPLPKALVERLDKFAKRAKGIGEKRNRLVHDVWFFNHPEPPERLEATARQRLRFEYIPTKIDDILKTARDINDLHGEFDVLAQAVETWKPPSPDRPPQMPLP
jgi:hypothetical protein